MNSDKFRRQLRAEAKLWQAENLISASLYEQLAERYQFNALETASQNSFLAILIGLGAVLLGLGVITFVAANWQAWSREVKWSLLLVLFIVVNTGGFSLWRTQKSGRGRRFGEGLLLLGALILGANLALSGQMFHIEGSSYGLFLIWGLGVLLMSYSLRLTSLGVLSILLIVTAYWQGVSQLFSPGEFSWIKLLMNHFALASALLFVPLAYWCRSRAVFAGALFAILPALQFSLAGLLNFNLPAGLYVVLACALPIGLLWGYDDTLWPQVERKFFQPLARTLALWLMALTFFWASFYWLWNLFSASSLQNPPPIRELSPLIDISIFIGFTVWEWLHLAKPSRLYPKRWGLEAVDVAVAGLTLASASVAFWHLTVGPISILATFIFNVLMFLLAAGLIRLGLARGKRDAFWGGLVLLTLQIMSRMFEYNTELLLKSLVFVLCGVGVIAAGFWFERHFARTKEEG